jgi:hypothetical protein
MSGLVRATVAETVTLLEGLIANPVAIDKFAEFFTQIGERQFLLAVSDAEYKDPKGGESLLGCVVTVTAHEQGQFEMLQGFLPIEETAFQKTGKRWFTDFLVPEFGTVIQLTDGLVRSAND